MSFARIVPVALLLALTASSSRAAAYVKFDGIDGSLAADHFDIAAFGDDHSAAIAVPSLIKNSRRASASLADMACDGLMILRMTIEVTGSNGRDVTQRYEMTNVMVSSYRVTGGAEAPREEVAFQFEKVTFANLETGETRTIDCSSGRCSCVP